jgi:hypothetical protein
MNQHKALFEKFKEGKLKEAGIEELHHSLLETYFFSVKELTSDEVEYTEDLIIELVATGKLTEKYVTPFQDAVAGDTMLNRKFHLLRDLIETRENIKNKQVSLLSNSENSVLDEKEEEDLAKILKESIEKVHAEHEAGQVKARTENLVLRLNNYFRELIPTIPIHQPQLRAALVFASVVLVAVVVWLSIRPEHKPLISGNSKQDTTINKRYIKSDSSKLKTIKAPNTVPPEIRNPQYASVDSSKNSNLKKDQLPNSRHKIQNFKTTIPSNTQDLLAYVDLPEDFEVYQTRSGSSTDIDDAYIDAAQKYNDGLYEGCISGLNRLLDGKYFSNADTLNEIFYYLGNSYMAKALKKSDSKMFKLSLESYSKIDPSSSYYNDACWFSAWALLKTGKKRECISILDSLLKKGFQKSGKVKRLRDSLNERNP